MRYALDALAALEAQLAALPELPRTTLTGKELVAQLAATIAELRKKGYRLRDVADLLRAREIHVKETTLRAYLRLARRRPQRRRAYGGRTKEGTVELTAHHSSAASPPRIEPAPPPPSEDPSERVPTAVAANPRERMRASPPTREPAAMPSATSSAPSVAAAAARRAAFALRPDRDDP